MLCAIKHAEPVTYCTTCYEEFTKVLISYRSLLSGSEMQYGANVSCKSMYIDKDRLNVIENVVRQAQDMWEAGYCSGKSQSPAVIASETCRSLSIW